MRENGRADARWVSCCMALGAILVGCIVLPEPKFTVSPESLTFKAAVGDESVPEQLLRIEDPEGQCGVITVTADKVWVTVTPTGRLAYVGAPWHFSIGVTLDGLAKGTHTATITVRSDRDGAEVLVPVTLTISIQAEGYVAISTGPIIIPRELIVGFEEGMSDAEMEAVIATAGSEAVPHTAGSTWYLIETPLGYSLQETVDALLAHPSVSSCSPYQGNFCGYSVYALMAEDGSGTLWPLAGGVDPGLEDVVLEYIVRVRGHEIDMGYLDVTSVDILRDRVLEKRGTITLVDRGSEGTVVILVEDSGAAWELLGSVAEEIAALPDIDGKTATIHGCERPLSLTSRAGGLEFRVNSYELDAACPDQPCDGTDTFEAIGVIQPAAEKWVTASGGRITHVLEGIGFRVVVTGSVCDVHLDAIPKGTKLRLSAGSAEIAAALAASEGGRVLVSGMLPHLCAAFDSDGPVPPEGVVTSVRSLATRIEAYGIPVPVSEVPGLTAWTEDTIPPGATHAFLDPFGMYPQPWPPGFYPELPPFPCLVRYFLEPTGSVVDLAPLEGMTVCVEGDLSGNDGWDPRIIRVLDAQPVSNVEPDRASTAVGVVALTSDAVMPDYELSRPSADTPWQPETMFYLSGDSAIDPATLEGSWVEVSGEVLEGAGTGTFTLSVDSAAALPSGFDYQDHVRLSGWVGRADPADGFTPSAATHNLGRDAGLLLPAVWTVAHLRSEQVGLLEQWEGCGPVFVEGTVDSWITREGDQSFGTLVNVTSVVSPFEGVWLVDDDALPGGNGRSWATAFQHPQDAVDAASAGEEVWVAEGTYTRRDSGDTVLLTMKDGVALYGGFAATEAAREDRDCAAHETALDGEDVCHHVVVGASDATLDGFTVMGGSGDPTSFSGGAMLNDSVANLTVANCTFTGNSAEYGGGGMYNRESSPEVVDCIFTGNSAGWGAGIYNRWSSALVSGCTFTANSAGYGAGIYSWESTATVTNCTFTGNSASAGGGMFNRTSSPVIISCTFGSNSAGCSGGGMDNWESSPAVTDCTFTSNSASAGGGMANRFSSSPEVMDCTFTGNSAIHGGGMYGYDNSSPIVTNCAFTDNAADNRGGGMYNNFLSSPVVTNCTFSRGSAYAGGGMCNYNRCSPVVDSCTFGENSAAWRGGGVSNQRRSSPRLANCTFVGNTADCGGGVHDDWYSSPTAINCTFTSNSAGEGGGISNCNSSPTITNCILWGDMASDGPEICDKEDSSSTVTYSCVGQSGFTDSPDDHNINADPLFVHAANGDLRLQDASPCIDAGTADGAPGHDLDGGVRPFGSAVDMGAYEWSCPLLPPPTGVQATSGPWQITITWDPVPGAASYNIYWTDDDSLPSKENGTKIASVSSPWVFPAGLLKTYRFVVTAVDAFAESAESEDVFGCPCLPELPPDVTVWFVDDDALPGGDGLSWATAFQHPQDAADAASDSEEVWVAEGTYTRRDSADTVLLTMKNGVALYGGFAGTETSRDARDWSVHETILDGEDAADHVVAGASHGRLDGLTVTGGSANEGVRPDYNGGGGMRNESVTNLTVTNCTFAGSSGLLGGGMYNENSSLTVTDCAFTGNSAGIHGGGIENRYCPSLEIVNCTFTGNSAFWDGGGMRSYDSSLTVTNCTFADNSAGSGGGMVNCGGSSADIMNCILWGNVAPNGPEVCNDTFTGTSCVVTYSCIGQAGYTDNPDDHNINADPLFMDPANGDLHLSASSPCIDAGTADGAPDHDLDGYPRPSGWGVDMGAYEQRNGYDETFTITSNVALSGTFETVEQGAFAVYESYPKGAYFFSTAAEFGSFYSTLRGNMLPPPAPPAVDFAQYRVVVVVDNGQVSTGYSVEITSIELDSGDQYNVTALFTEPTGLVGWAITKPYHIVKVAIQ